MTEVRLSKTQAMGYHLFAEKIAQQERQLAALKAEANEFLSEVVREAGHEPDPRWRLDRKTLTLYLPENGKGE